MDDASDLELVLALSNGENAAAARVFVLRFRHVVMRSLRGFHQFRPDEIEDVFQDVFAKLFANGCERLRAWRGGGSLAAYIGTIARRLALDYLDARQRIPECAPVEDLDELIGDVEDPETVAIINQLQRMMLRAIQQLGPPKTDLLMAVDIHGLSYAEVGRQLNWTPNNVGVQLHNARGALKRLIRQEYPALQTYIGDLN